VHTNILLVDIHSEIPQVVSASKEVAYIIHKQTHSSASISGKSDSVTLPQAVRTHHQHFLCAAQTPTVSEPQNVFIRGKSFWGCCNAAWPFRGEPNSDHVVLTASVCSVTELSQQVAWSLLEVDCWYGKRSWANGGAIAAFTWRDWERPRETAVRTAWCPGHDLMGRSCGERGCGAAALGENIGDEIHIFK